MQMIYGQRAESGGEQQIFTLQIRRVKIRYTSELLLVFDRHVSMLEIQKAAIPEFLQDSIDMDSAHSNGLSKEDLSHREAKCIPVGRFDGLRARINFQDQVSQAAAP